MFEILLKSIKWIFHSNSFLLSISVILFILSLFLSIDRDDFPFLVILSLLSIINSLIFLNEYRINKQLKRLQIQIHKFNKIIGMVHIASFELLMIIALSRNYLINLQLQLSILVILLPSIFLLLDLDSLVYNQYNLGSVFRHYVNEEKLSASPVSSSANINLRRNYPYWGKVQIDWSLENGKEVTWLLKPKNSDVISYIASLMHQPQTTFVNGIPIYTQLENIQVSDEIRNIVQSS